MLASTPTGDYVSFRPSRRDESVPNSRHSGFETPPRLAGHPFAHSTPLLTPSPLRRHAPPTAEPMDMDDVFQSPLRPPSYTHRPYLARSPRVHFDVPAEDDHRHQQSVYHSPSFVAPPSTSPFVVGPSFRTPARESTPSLETPDRLILSPKQVNTLPSSRVGTNTDRKPASSMCATPQRERTMTPLLITSSTKREGDSASVPFDRLAPLPAPRFTPRCHPNKAQTDMHLRKQEKTMTMLQISDSQRGSDVDSDYDTELEFGEPETSTRRPLLNDSDTSRLGAKLKVKGKILELVRSPAYDLSIRKNEDVAEAVSPGGHVTKRRARARHVSSELLESAQFSSATCVTRVNPVPPHAHDGHSLNAVSSSATQLHSRRSASSLDFLVSRSSRARPTPSILPKLDTQTQPPRPRTFERMASAATLFFGPSIPDPRKSKPASDTGANTSSGRKKAVNKRSHARNRHSYAGRTSNSTEWRDDSDASSSLSSSPNRRKREDDSEEERFFNSSDSTSSSSSLREGIPSPKKKQRLSAPSPLLKKFRPQDSGVAFDSSDDDEQPARSRSRPDLLPMPRASTSVSTVNSEEALPTPGFVPSATSGWPVADTTLARSDDESAEDVNAVILHTLMAGSSNVAEGHKGPKKVPGTPVKKVKTANMMVRPWQSVMASKVGHLDFDNNVPKGGRAKSKPRKSMPAAFPILEKENCATFKIPKLSVNFDADDDDEDVSPIALRRGRYEGLSLGRGSRPQPSSSRPVNDSKGGRMHMHLLKHRSSSNFSSGGETPMGTPTRSNVKDWKLPPPRLTLSPVKRQTPVSSQEVTTPTASAESVGYDSPSVAVSVRHQRAGASMLPQPTPVRAPLFSRPHTHAHPARLPMSHSSPVTNSRARLLPPNDEEQPGRFKRDFEEVDELGTGEFGRVMKVTYNDEVAASLGQEGQLFAVKISKRFEGAKHRLRLREEVDILSHLSARGGHPNVLAYIDGWEEDEALYIRTELCSLGNFAHFLLAYGRAYPKLDEGRVWRILTELSDGLRFIHDAGVIHLDLKPENIFITSSGRLKIGDFGMASMWPRPLPSFDAVGTTAFEREGDKMYLAPEVLQGHYGKAADVFSLGITILEAATNIVVPGEGEAWHRLRQEDFSQVDSGLVSISLEMQGLIRSMLRTDSDARIEIRLVAAHPVVSRARAAMEAVREAEGDVFAASPLGAGGQGFLAEILHRKRGEH